MNKLSAIIFITIGYIQNACAIKFPILGWLFEKIKKEEKHRQENNRELKYTNKLIIIEKPVSAQNNDQADKDARNQSQYAKYENQYMVLV